MRLVAGCLIALAAMIVYDDAANAGRYRIATGKMVGHMMNVTWIR
jgi:hypothetical protein